jgi:hypothetical protein
VLPLEVLCQVARRIEFMDKLFYFGVIRWQRQGFADADEAYPWSLFLVLDEDGPRGNTQRTVGRAIVSGGKLPGAR